MKFKENRPYSGTQPGFLGISGSKLHWDVGFWLLRLINMLIMTIKWPGNTYLKEIYRHIKIKLMAPSAPAEGVKIEVSHDVGRQPGRQGLWRAWFVMLSLSGKGVVWGKMQTQMMGTTGRRLMSAALLESAARVMKSSGFEDYVWGDSQWRGGQLSSPDVQGRLPSWHGWWSCRAWTPDVPVGSTRHSEKAALAVGYAPFILCGHCFLRVETLFCGLLLYLHLPL